MLGRVFPDGCAGLRQMMLEVGPDAAAPEGSSGSPVFNMADGDSAFMFLKKRGLGMICIPSPIEPCLSGGLRGRSHRQEGVNHRDIILPLLLGFNDNRNALALHKRIRIERCQLLVLQLAPGP